MSVMIAKSPRSEECAAFQRRISPMRAIVQWHHSLPGHLRDAPGSALYELGVHIYQQMARPRGSRLVHEAAEGISELAEHCLDAQWPAERFTGLMMLRPRSVELGLLILGAALLKTGNHFQDRFRDQEFYPAVLLEDVLETIDARGDHPARWLLLMLVADQAKELVAQLKHTAEGIEHGYGRVMRWPQPPALTALAGLTDQLQKPWDRLASELLHAVPSATDQLELGLVMRLFRGQPLRQQVEGLLTSINRNTQVQNPRGRLLDARDWPRRASATLRCLAKPSGWLQLYFAYISYLLPGIKRRAERLGTVAVLEVIEREVINPIALGEDAVGFSYSAEGEGSVHPLGMPRFGVTRRRRLCRQRRECMQGFLGALALGDLPFGDWSKLLKAIGERYFCASWAGESE